MYAAQGWQRLAALAQAQRVVRLGLVAIAALAAFGLLIGFLARSPQAAPVVELPAESAAPSPPAYVVVDVVGAVARPGVVRLPAGSRVLDALLAAGGMTGEADLFALNKAAPLRDGMRIYVPRPGETPPAGSLGSAAEMKLDLNSASLAELVALPGVGPSTAARIVRSREQRRFSKVDELQMRGLVTPRVLAEMRELVAVR